MVCVILIKESYGITLVQKLLIIEHLVQLFLLDLCVDNEFQKTVIQVSCGPSRG